MFLGVDGGGTKVAYTLIDADGGLVARVSRPGGANYLNVGKTVARATLAEGIRVICTAGSISPSQIDYAFFGMPAYGEVFADTADLDKWPAELLGHNRYRVDNDVVAGWAGSLGAHDGIHVVSGTGSIAYGQLGERGLRAGGWGDAFGDEGSGYRVGEAGLSLFAQMSDGRMAPGPLLALMRERFSLQPDLDAIRLVYHTWERNRAKIAAVSRVVDEAAQAGDQGAVAILINAADELTKLVVALSGRLGFPGPGEASGKAGVLVSYSGGMFSSILLRDRFKHNLGTRYDLRRPLLAPDVGAALLAARLAGRPIPEQAVAELGLRDHDFK